MSADIVKLPDRREPPNQGRRLSLAFQADRAIRMLRDDIASMLRASGLDRRRREYRDMEDRINAAVRALEDGLAAHREEGCEHVRNLLVQALGGPRVSVDRIMGARAVLEVVLDELPDFPEVR